jgi:hypothetical protein
VGAGSARGKEAKALLEILASPAQDQAKRDAGLIPAH